MTGTVAKIKEEWVKLVIVGDGTCGKTCMLHVFKTGEFLESHVPTVFETSVEDMDLDGRKIKLTLWDTAGQESYERLRPLSYPKTDIFLIAFSLDNPDSLVNVEAKWVKEVRHFCNNAPIILVGNKLDLRVNAKEKETIIQTSKTKSVASKISANAWIECSAKTQENIKELFTLAAKTALKKRGQEKKKKESICLLL